MSETHPSRLPPLPRPAGCPVGGQVIDFFVGAAAAANSPMPICSALPRQWERESPQRDNKESDKND